MLVTVKLINMHQFSPRVAFKYTKLPSTCHMTQLLPCYSEGPQSKQPTLKRKNTKKLQLKATGM